MKRQKAYTGDELIKDLEALTAVYDGVRTQVLAKKGIRPDRMFALRQAAEDGGVGMSTLTEKMKLERYQVSRIVAWLVDNNLATRSKGRSRTVTATPRGRKVVEWVDGAIKAGLIELLPGSQGRSTRLSRIGKYIQEINHELYQPSLLEGIEPFAGPEAGFS